MLQKLICIFVFCVLTAEFDGGTFEGHWSTPWHYVADVLFAPVPGIRLWYLDGLILIFLAIGRAQAGAMTGRAKPMQQQIWWSIAAIVIWVVWGVFKGANILDMRVQLHAIMMMFTMSFMYMAAFRTPEHFRMLGKAIVYAALFRFGMIFLFYVLVMRHLNEYIATITDHGDSILFTLAIVIMIANAIHARDKKATWRAIGVLALMLWCIQMNNRRLAWVSLIGALLIIYFLLPSGRIRRKVHRGLLYAAPVLALYTAAGWSHPTGFFKPIASIQSMNDSNDPSTESRNLENLGLIVTLQTAPLMGQGWGHEYIEVSNTFSAGVVFKEYRYVPHNSILGLAAFMGGLGFAMLWLVFPVAAYFGARSYNLGKSPLEKTIAMCVVCEILIHTNQMWGDIGINAPQGIVLMSAAFAAASRSAIWSGAWPSKKKKMRSADEIPAAVGT